VSFMLVLFLMLISGVAGIVTGALLMGVAIGVGAAKAIERKFVFDLNHHEQSK